MNGTVSPRLASRLHSLSKAASVPVSAVGCSVVVGWKFDIGLLKSGLPGLVTMKANAACAFLLAGVSLWLLRSDGPAPWKRWTAQVCAFTVALVGLLTLGEYLFGWDLGIDQLLFQELPGAFGTSSPGRMPPTAALNFLVIGLALLLLDVETRRGHRPAQLLALPAALTALLAVVGYAYGVTALYGIAPYTQMTLHGALTFLVLCGGILLAHPNGGLVRILSSEGPGGIAARRLLPAGIVIPLLLGWLRLQGQRAGLYDNVLGLALFAVANVIVFTVLVWLNAGSLHQADIQRLRAEAKFQGIVETAPDAIIGADPEGRIVLVNARAESLFGYTREELLGQAVEILLPERLRAAHEGRHAAYLSAPHSEQMGARPDLFGRRKDGSEFPVDITLSALETEERIRVTSIIRGVTQRQQAERKFRKLLEAAPDAMVITNPKGEIELVNTQTGELFGYRAEELQGQPVEILMPERFRVPHATHRVGYFADPHARPMGAGLELCGRRKDGSEFPVEISLSPLETEEGLLVSSAIRDITERKRAEEEIKKLNEDLARRAAELEAVNWELEAFTYSVSHDLRAPLRHIDGFSRILLEDFRPQLAPAAQHSLARIHAAVQHMGCLLDDLLNLARIGRQELKVQITGLNGLVSDALAELEPEMQGRQIDWQIGPLPFAECDPGLMKQVFANLLANALKFTRPRERAVVEVGQVTSDGLPVVFVRDNGVGFNMKYADKLFGVFQRLHRQEDFGGTGVGLATAQRIIHKHGGRVWAEAELEKGATFYFTLGPARGVEAKNNSVLTR